LLLALLRALVGVLAICGCCGAGGLTRTCSAILATLAGGVVVCVVVVTWPAGAVAVVSTAGAVVSVCMVIPRI
jgi:hypothetical protein